jgi:Rhodopirellula transposase DDE domain/Helix-turn-helix of DDE superfamily endonuclease
MAVDALLRDQLSRRFDVLLPYLDERQKRLALATEARLIGHGGVRAVAVAAGVSEATVRAGVSELEAADSSLPVGRSRRPGGGRKPASQHDPSLVKALLGLVEPDERGDPMSPLRWTTKSLRHLAEELSRSGHPVSAPTVGRLLKTNGFSLQSTSKTLEGVQHPDRDAQFRYISEQVKTHQADGQPVISVDAKKKEQLGQLPAAGREWRPKGDPVAVEDHSFFTAGPDVPLAVPYGIYDIAADAGWVNVGVDHDTSAFAVASIRRWWRQAGSHEYPGANRLLITADAGGSNSYRYRLWKAELAAFAAEAGLSITICHFPPGTSKWNKIEHRLFSAITLNWRGRPLTSHEVVLATINTTRTRRGLNVHAELDENTYPLGIAVSTQELRQLPIQPHEHHGEWNYTIAPTGTKTAPVTADDRARNRVEALRLLADERITGMSGTQLSALADQLAPAQHAQAAQRRFEQRGGPRRRARGAGSTRILTPADAVLITVVYQRQVCSQKVLGELLGVSDMPIGLIISETRQLLGENDIQISPATLRFKTAAELRDYATSERSLPERSRTPQLLAHPELTGMPPAELAAMTARVRKVLQARGERHRHRRRGGETLPGARGGVFTQKITPEERVLATVLYQRKLCSQDTLAELFTVSRRTIGNVIREVGPALTQDGYTPTPADRRFPTARSIIDTATRHS